MNSGGDQIFFLQGGYVGLRNSRHSREESTMETKPDYGMVHEAVIGLTVGTGRA